MNIPDTWAIERNICIYSHEKKILLEMNQQLLIFEPFSM